MGSRSPTHDDDFLDSKATARLLGVSIDTLKDWRGRGHGPAFHRLGHRTVRYRLSDIEAWLSSQRVASNG